MFRRKKQTPTQTPARRSPTGSNPQVFSYYARGNTSNDQNLGRNAEREAASREKKGLPMPHVGALPSFLALVFIFGIILYSLWIQPRPKIVVLSQPNTIYQDTSAYQKAINAAWGAQFGNQFKLSVNGRSLEKQITAAVPDVASAQVQLPLVGRRPTVVLTPGKPAMELITLNGGFYVDQNGTVMARTSDVKQNQLKDVAKVQDESGIKAEPGKTILTAAQARYIQTLSRQLSAAGLSVQSMTLPANSVNEVDVRLNGQNYYIKFATTGDARQGVGTFLAAKNKFDTDHVTPSEYIDVRIDEKVFYK